MPIALMQSVSVDGDPQEPPWKRLQVKGLELHGKILCHLGPPLFNKNKNLSSWISSLTVNNIAGPVLLCPFSLHSVMEAVQSSVILPRSSVPLKPFVSRNGVKQESNYHQFIWKIFIFPDHPHQITYQSYQYS